ncbi:RHS repeat-associated core domain-containing protein [Neptunicella marina]|uniref:RHS repeat-associated core domain-containing protein n=1 Tax=Neptunicella marina TaxID=2125989 RepID=A0A8J6IWC5_9ALTE|nr:RHS repeat-associated core domain-containing protein [Neptunicella marina]MBC3766713.1 RHS repeat-associated core domain-containing protein [Neptunicella marina]
MINKYILIILLLGLFNFAYAQETGGTGDEDEPIELPQQTTQLVEDIEVDISILEPQVPQRYPGSTELGDGYNPVTGEVTFAVTDISIPGNSTIPVELRRWIPSGDLDTGGPTGWKWDIPFIKGNYLDLKDGHTDYGWNWGNNTWHDGKNCTGSADSVMDTHSELVAAANLYWTGKLLHIPDITTETFLTNGSEQITKSNFKITGCINNPDGQEGIIVAGPNGLTYTFNQIKSYYNGKEAFKDPIIRTRILMVSKIEDQFGNYVDYEYVNGELHKIEGSNGRLIEVTYDTTEPQIPVSATANGRTWNYTYQTTGHKYLSTVELPNNTFWQYNNLYITAFDPNDQLGSYNQTIQYNSHDGPIERPSCGYSSTVDEYAYVITPENTRIDYTFHERFHNRSNVEPAIVWGMTQGVDGTARNLNCTVSLSLTQRAISGPDVEAFQWQYDYSEQDGSYDAESALYVENEASSITTPVGGFPAPITTSNAVNYRTVTVSGPDKKTIYYIDREFQSPTEGMVIAEDTLSVSNSLLKRVEKTYVQGDLVGSHWYLCPCGGDYPPLSSVNGNQLSYRINLSQSAITLPAAGDDDKYITSYDDFDAYGYVGETNELHMLGSNTVTTRNTTQDYLHDDGANWHLGMPTLTRIKNSNNIFVPLKETTYKTLTGTNEGRNYSVKVPYEHKEYDVWKSRYASYHADGNVEKIEFNQPLTDANGNLGTGTFRYKILSNYKRGTPQSIVVPKRYMDSGTLSASRTVDNNGWVISTTDLKGNTYGYGYDDIGRLNYIDAPDNWLDTYFDWSQGAGEAPVRTARRCTLNASKSGCSGAVSFETEVQFDALMRPILTTNTDVTNSQSRYQNKIFNAYSQETFSSYWSASSTETGGTTNTYDGLQRLHTTSQTGGGTQTINYLSGNKQQVIDAEGNVTTTTYLAYGEPSYDQALTIESPESVTTTQTINIFGDITSVTQSGLNVSQTEYRAYDAQHNLCKVSRNDVGTAVFIYTVLGEVSAKAEGVTGGSNTNCTYTSDVAKEIKFTYDNLGQLWKTTYPDYASNGTTPLENPAADVVYARDNNGNVETLTAGNVVHDYHYNSLNLLDDETLIAAGQRIAPDSSSKSLVYGYNSAGHLNSLTYPDGDMVTYAPNGFGEPTQAVRTTRGGQDYATSATYYPTGSLNTFSYGNGLTHKTTLNTRKVPSSIKDSKTGTTALHYSYIYDDNLNVTRLTDNVNNAYSLTNLTYDGLDRLKTTTGNSGIGSSSLTYDGLGNILTYNSKGQSLGYNYNTADNRLTSVTGISGKYSSFTYDDRGNIYGNGSKTFTYNRANQLVSSGSYTYLYDGNNRRVKQTDSKGTSYSLYSQDGTLLYRETPDGGINYIYLGKKLIAKDGFIPENAGKQHYRPFGSSIDGNEIDDVGYTGHKFDTDLGLSYMQARYYDPVIGRFYSNDPVGPNRTNPIMSFNRYIYVNNNPYKYTDPTGMELECPTTTRCTVTVPRPKVTTTGLRNIIFNESRSLSGNSERRVRRFMAHTILNGDEKYGENRPSTASDKLGNIIDPSELKLLEEIEGIIKQVYFERSEGIDSVGGAMHFNFRDLNFLKVYNKDLMSPMHGRDVKYSIGPLKNSYPTKELGSAGIYFTVYQ